MVLKKFLIVAAAAVSLTASAQDKIYKKNGEVIEASVKDASGRDIKYRTSANSFGSASFIPAEEVSKIVYQDGTVDVFDNSATGGSTRSGRPGLVFRAADGTVSQAKFGSRIVTFSPLQFTENGFGLSVGYEKVLDKAGYISATIPFVATFNLNNGTYQDNYGTTHNGHSDVMLYLMPGLKIYPGGSHSVVNYAIGPSLVMGTGEKSNAVYANYPNYGIISYDTKDHQELGMIVNNSLNINPSEHIYLGLEFGFGFTYFSRVGGLNDGTKGLVQGAFKLGYRF